MRAHGGMYSKKGRAVASSVHAWRSIFSERWQKTIAIITRSPSRQPIDGRVPRILAVHCPFVDRNKSQHRYLIIWVTNVLPNIVIVNRATVSSWLVISDMIFVLANRTRIVKTTGENFTLTIFVTRIGLCSVAVFKCGLHSIMATVMSKAMCQFILKVRDIPNRYKLNIYIFYVESFRRIYRTYFLTLSVGYSFSQRFMLSI